ncbi:Aquaporin-3 [Apophysomyces ossiformis]|uniref:Aquaporin-3 n=1 Tax=Apophysomyces ossiformis TaxID=679940 RepID=A0A8H7BSI2_9FUNG|nr:Aquaporin-3 [Apophysomyces ossiformis]
MSARTLSVRSTLEKVVVVKNDSTNYATRSSNDDSYNDNEHLEIISTSRRRCHRLLTSLRNFRHKYREPLAEFFATLIVVLLIDGLFLSLRIWSSQRLSGLAVLTAICLAGHVSGAHINPAITLVFCWFGDFPGYKVPIYWFAQLVGGFCGAALLYPMILPAINRYDGGIRTVLGPTGTAGVFATYPPPYVSPTIAAFSEFIGTAVLAIVVLGSGNPQNIPFSSFQGVMVGIGLTAIILAFGYTSGFSLNPARDFGPRVFTAIAGWGLDVFTVQNYYMFVPLFVPLVGATFGSVVYSVFIDQ